MEKPLTLLLRNRTSLPLVLIPLLLVLAVPIASAEWYKDYEEAIQFIKKRQCSDAIPLLISAVKEKKEEGTGIKFYGMNFGDYYPHYYLGSCYFQLTSYSAALAELETSENQGQIQRKKDLWNQLNQMKAVARAQISLKTQPNEANQTAPPPSSTRSPLSQI